MPILSTPSSAFPISLVYITIGVLVDIWAGVAMVFYPPETNWGKFLLFGCLASGFALLVIGLLLGPIGRAARNAELPPTEATPAVAQADQTAAAHPAPLVPAAPQTGEVIVPTQPPHVTPDGTPAMPAPSR